MPETTEHRIKRLQMRSMRRGIKEMDLILSSFAAAHLPQLSEADLVLYDQLLNENDHDIYQWVTRQVDAPDRYRLLVAAIQNHMDA
ncbi:succinate dehydrogenase assembly factor 2 [Sulfitobacter aestuariivivens]|uniref:FAD assembly factor SdhE n=1 Tax=Sulfitobacter aestuariivivens TaxID=2766981 RepID=A0A927HDX2_9RHOB|nr:succinate dehydrogenase assembly factor 2 [Sulfitobacter aestuariivivens]MBD3662739.1 succinate dehydrogenase assembly factor 2 [Sulfitobacter aestuariivivens]